MWQDWFNVVYAQVKFDFGTDTNVNLKYIKNKKRE